jgi:hypothetical protein
MAEHGIRAEIIRETAPLLLGRRVEQPRQQEERHHGRDEVGISHLPRAAVMAARDNLFLADEDFGLGVALPSAAAHWPGRSRYRDRVNVLV